eukprot:COSAG01_NODE_53542_length_338_cov_1.087866_1_plen_34_part_01
MAAAHHTMASAPRVLALAAVGLGACVYARRATAA